MTQPDYHPPAGFYWGWVGVVADPLDKPGRRRRCVEWMPLTPSREAAIAGEPIPLRISTWDMGVPADVLVTQIGEGPMKANASLHLGLQDLGNQIAWEASQACKAFDNPDLWYPGVDVCDIEPVSDDHVRLVMWAMQRELDRELRPSRYIGPVTYGVIATGTVSDTGSTVNYTVPPNPATKRPAAPLAELPWRIQRALAERRRYWYGIYGIGREQWLSNTWTLAGVREDPEWVPEWLQ